MFSRELAGSWLLALDPENRGREERWFERIRPDAQNAPVPGIIQQVFPDRHGVAWYYHKFNCPHALGRDERAELSFGAVDYLAAVWLNGREIGGHEGGETPFRLDASAALQEDNLLAVRVLNPVDEPIDGIRLAETPHRNKFVKMQPGCGYNYGGILLPVVFNIVPSLRIADVFALPDPRSGEIAVAVAIRNDSPQPASVPIFISSGPMETGTAVQFAELMASCPPGESTHRAVLRAPPPRLWSLEDPYLYFVETALQRVSLDRRIVRCGFRDFRVSHGYFYLNGKRVFLKSTHTGNHFPMGQCVAHNRDFMWRDLLYAKSFGFNTVRFISGVAWPEQLDYCDQIGLMIYEECLAAWMLGDSPRVGELYGQSVREMILRDRNHPSVTIWGLLNETGKGPVYELARNSLAKVRALDPSRLVLLSSGRWDNEPKVGTVCNPGRMEWEYQWGAEAPDARPVLNAADANHGGYFDKMGDVHVYPKTPLPRASYDFLRRLGHDCKPIFLSEFGTGSLFNAIDEQRKFVEAGAKSDLPDLAYIRSMRDRFEKDWKRFGMESVYPFPEDFFRDSYRLNIRQRRLNFDLLRSNPRFCGHNLTGMLDHALTGEGVWTFWREFKPGMPDALRDGWAPLRWCLITNPWHAYSGRPIRIEAVLANEDVLPPGDYPAVFRIFGPGGVAWERRAVVKIPKGGEPEPPPLAVSVLNEEVAIEGPPGEYTLAVSMDCAAPAGDRVGFRISGQATLPRLEGEVLVWGLSAEILEWLRSRGLKCAPFEDCQLRRRMPILVGQPQNGGPLRWKKLAQSIACGCTALFLSPQALAAGQDAAHWLPLAQKGRCYAFNDWLYHKECVGRNHPVFEGLRSNGIMDWDYYEEIIPRHIFDNPETPDDIAAAAFAVGYCMPGGYASGLLVARYPFAAGKFIVNTLNVLENFNKHPVADRLLINLVKYAQQDLGGQLVSLPHDIDEQIKAFKYDEICGTTSFKRVWELAEPLSSLKAVKDAAYSIGKVKTWRPYKSNDDFINLHALDGQTAGMVYARGEFTTDREMKLALLFGADGPAKIWIDEREIGCVENAGNPCVKDAHSFPVSLEKGRHRIVVAFERRGGLAWGFFARFKRADETFAQEELENGVRLPEFE